MSKSGRSSESPEASAALQIEPLTLEHVDEAASVISEAFRAEPISARMFDLEDPETRTRHARALAYQMRGAVEAGEPPLAAIEDGSVVGVAAVSRLSVTVVLRTVRSWITLLPRVRWAAWGIGLAAKPSRRVPRPHLLLEGIGVAPQAQGRGVGSALMRAVVAECDAKEECRGIYLQTASERARVFYERAGFELVDERSGAGLTVAHLFRRSENGP